MPPIPPHPARILLTTDVGATTHPTRTDRHCYTSRGFRRADARVAAACYFALPWFATAAIFAAIASASPR